MNISWRSIGALELQTCVVITWAIMVEICGGNKKLKWFISFVIEWLQVIKLIMNTFYFKRLMRLNDSLKSDTLISAT